MSFVFRCPSCQAEREATKQIIGRRVRCSECNHVSRVPDPRDTEPDKPDDFDPVYQWLAIPPREQPANHYRLLGVSMFEPDPDVIAVSADRQMVHVKAQATGRYANLSQELLNKLSKARACLLDPVKRQAYDDQLRAEEPMLAEDAGDKKPKISSALGAAPMVDVDINFDDNDLMLKEDAPSSAPAPVIDDLPDLSSDAGDFPDLMSMGDDLPDLMPADESLQVGGGSEALAPEPDLDAIDPLAGTDDLQTSAMTAPESSPDAKEQPKSRWSKRRRGKEPEPEPAPKPKPDPEPLLAYEPDELDEPDDRVLLNTERGDREAEMDMTPMVDVTFLLLIFFMVTAAFSLQKSIQMPAQKNDEPSPTVTQEEIEDDPDYVMVLVDPYNTYHVTTTDWEEEAPSEHELLIRLRRARQGNDAGKIPNKLMVTAHGDALYEKVIAALDAGSEVGMEEMQVVMTDEEFE